MDQNHSKIFRPQEQKNAGDMQFKAGMGRHFPRVQALFQAKIARNGRDATLSRRSGTATKTRTLDRRYHQQNQRPARCPRADAARKHLRGRFVARLTGPLAIPPDPRYFAAMPYQWTPSQDQPDAPRWHLCLWPHRSLPPHGFAAFIGITFLMLLFPLFSVLGSPILWGLLPFLMGAVALVWYFLNRSYRDGDLREDLSLYSDRIELIRQNPRGPRQSWQANPYWVSVEFHEKGGPVENYVTLKGAGREVEIGAFLSADERVDSFQELSDKLHKLDVNAPK